MQSITILVVSGQGLSREGLLTVIRSQDDFDVAGVEATGIDALCVAAACQPHIALIDADLPPRALNHLLQSLPAASPKCRAILISRGLTTAAAMRAIQLGVRGLLNTSAAPALVFKSIRAVMAGEYWIGRGLVSELARAAANQAGVDGGAARAFNLTSRERQVLALVAGGGTNKDAAQQLGLSVETIKHHLTRIFGKVGVSSRLELAIFAVAHGLHEASAVDSTF